ncbi:hypothetical protein BRCON_1033 [Candidatus Sumerlaea chitinivorans]|uniref:Uncharacterized protein n=1 Tax=Sumerlaea chitinivorans TaxID=2250252 RepID=A0A2Z4Y3U2_SUMC1|nr:hypothetical protein BRCON_1033 [Candidatus Sumerlaea chitinivorans]
MKRQANVMEHSFSAITSGEILDFYQRAAVTAVHSRFPFSHSDVK